MQAQVVHQRKVSIPWLPALIAALVVGGIVLTTCNPRYASSQRLIVEADLTQPPA